MIQNLNNTDRISVKVKNGTFKCYITNNISGGEPFYKDTFLVLAVIKILIDFFTKYKVPSSFIYNFNARDEKCNCFLWCRWVEGGFIQINLYDYFLWTNTNPTLPKFKTIEDCKKHSLTNFDGVSARYAHHYHLDDDEFVLVIDTVFGAPEFQFFRTPKVLSITDTDFSMQAGCLSAYHVLDEGCVTDRQFIIDISEYLTVAKTP